MSRLATMDWTIRRADAGDAALLALVGAATFLETFADLHTGAEIADHCAAHHSAEAYAALFAKGAEGWLVETAATAAPVGYGLLTEPELAGSAPGDLELKRIYMLSRLHGSGAGAETMGRMISRARERGAHRLLLDVYGKNERAVAFYGKYGFEKIADNRFYVGATGYDDIVLALNLGAR